MIKFIFCLLLVIAFCFANDFTAKIAPKCGHELVKWNITDAVNFYAEREEIMKMWEANPPLQTRALKDVRIAVVWHVIHAGTTSDTYISADIINREMAWLNDWYSAKNKYIANTNSQWSSVKAVADEFHIKFELAVKKPDGTAFNGINYVQSSTVANSCGDENVFSSASGGVDIWNTKYYYNVYTCKLNNGAAGFAYFPGKNTHSKDGCVMDIGTLGDDYYAGHVLAHESGHWLGLPHTFPSSTSCTSDADGVTDTPITDTNTFNYVTNSQTACDVVNRCNHPVQTQNVMDYNYGHCITFFTKGQLTKIRSWLDATLSVSWRAELSNSPALPATSCTPNCSGKTCGDNGCGGTCGTCSSGNTCNTAQQCVSSCTPNCSGKQCGDNGCGGSCGTCSSGKTCNTASQCITVCVPNCSGKQCGDNGCGGTCGTCSSGKICNTALQCVTPCTPNCSGKTCGDNGCGGSCGTCASGSSCIANNCQTQQTCNFATECLNAGYECNYANFCQMSNSCGTCPSSKICNNFKCQDDPCNGCGLNTDCVSGECICSDGYIINAFTGDCETPSSGGGVETFDYSNHFKQTFPLSPIGFSIPDTDLILSNTGDHIVQWYSTNSVVSKYTTKTEIIVNAPSGIFGFAMRHGQTTNSNDRVEWRIKDIGSSAKLAICLVYYGTSYCSSYSSYSFPANTDNKVQVTMGYDDNTSSILSTFKISSSTTTFSTTVSGSYFPSLGAIAYYLSRSSGTAVVMSDATLATSTVLQTSLVGRCIDDTEWSTLFYQLTGANKQTTSVQVRNIGENGRCAKSAATKELVSAFTFVVTSNSIPAAAIATTFIKSIGTPAAGSIGLASASVIAGSAGAEIAGFPASAAALPGTVIVAPIVGTAAGGAAAGGLSGGAIAGIVVGSVVGGILLIGVTAIIVAAVVVGAIILATRKSDDVEDSSPNDNPRMSRFSNFFGRIGGMDVMNSPKNNGHQSITARKPAF